MCLCMCVSFYLKRVFSVIKTKGFFFFVDGGVKTFVTYQEVVDFRCDQHITRKFLTEVTVTIAVFMYFSFVYCLNVFDVHMYMYLFVLMLVNYLGVDFIYSLTTISKSLQLRESLISYMLKDLNIFSLTSVCLYVCVCVCRCDCVCGLQSCPVHILVVYSPSKYI